MEKIESIEPHEAWREILSHTFDREPGLAKEVGRAGYVAWGMCLVRQLSRGRQHPGKYVLAMTTLAAAGLRAVEDGLLSRRRLREIDPVTVRMPEDLEEWLDALGSFGGDPDSPETWEVPEA